MKKRTSWYWALPAAFGLALVTMAVLLSSSSISSPGIPAVSAQTDDCDLRVEKSPDPAVVEAGGDVIYTITVENRGDEDGVGCDTVVVTDDLSNDLTCVSVTIVEDEGLDLVDEDAAEENCEDEDAIVWEFEAGDVLQGGETLEFEIVAATDDDLDVGDEIDNTAQASAQDAELNTVVEDEDTVTIEIGEAPTATPLPTATRAATAQPIPTIAPPPPAPTFAPPAVIAPPATGNGSDSGSTAPLAIGLGIAGLALLLVSGAVVVKRTR